MNPQDQQPHRPQSQSSSDSNSSQRDATANLIRDQISRLFGDPTATRSDAAEQPATPAAPAAQPQSTPSVSDRAQTLREAEQRLNQQRQAYLPQRDLNVQQRQPAPTQPQPTPTPTAVQSQPATPVSPPQPATQPATAPATAQPKPSQPAQANPVKSKPANQSPYQQTQQNTATISNEQWQKYHSSWQQYYQKYYERYYSESLAQQASTSSAQQVIGSGQPDSQSESTSDSTGLTKSQAIRELRSQIRQRVSSSASKVRKSRHFVPIIAACAVLILFVFLQYNRVLFATVEAYIAPGTVTPGDIIVDPSSTVALSDEPTLIIPKLNINVPAIYENTMGTTNQQTHDLQMKAMEQGVAWFGIPGANAKPGQNGNVVLSGHSSNDVIDPGEYKFIFARLDKLGKGDTIYLTYDEVRYTYSVTGTKVVSPSELDALRVGDDKPTLTLITCTPLGTSLNRLLVYADQISPDPTVAAEANDYDASENTGEMPGNSPTIMQRIFGAD